MRKLTFIAAAVSIALLGGCQQMTEQKSTQTVQVQPVQSEIDKANAFFEDTFNRDVARLKRWFGSDDLALVPRCATR